MELRSLDPKYLWYVEAEWDDGKTRVTPKRRVPNCGSYKETGYSWTLMTTSSRRPRKIRRLIRRCQNWCDKQNALLMGAEVKGFMSIGQFRQLMGQLQVEGFFMRAVEPEVALRKEKVNS